MISIILTGIFVSISCTLLGNFLILRRMSMIGDAISHAVLPGIVISFMLSGTKDSFLAYMGAASFGVLATFIIGYLNSQARLQTDAAIGITFTFMFAVGIILLSLFASQVDLDVDCVLYGEITTVPLDLWILGDGTSLGPLPLYKTGACLLLVFLVVIIFFRPLYLTTFDQSFASTLGLNTVKWHYLLMTTVSITTVSSFEAVGAILVIAFIIAPPCTAYLMTENFKLMILLSIVIDIIITIFGYILGVWLDSSIAGAMTVVSGIIFLLALLYYLISKNYISKHVDYPTELTNKSTFSM